MTFSGRRGGGRSGRSFRSSFRGAFRGARAFFAGVRRNIGRPGFSTSNTFVGQRLGQGSTIIAPVGEDHVSITVRFVYSASAVVTARWARSGSHRAEVGYNFQGSFTLTNRRVHIDNIDAAHENLYNRGIRLAEGLAKARAANLQQTALNRTPDIKSQEGYLRFSSPKTTVTSLSA